MVELIGLKEQVERAIRDEWRAFENAYPRLAAVIGQERMVEGAIAGLAEDAEYKDCLAEAEEAGMATGALGGLVRRFVGKWMAELVR